MTGSDIALIITAFGVAFVSIYAVVIANRVKAQGVVLDATHAATNSKMDKLLEVSTAAAKAVGVKEGRAEVKAEGAATKPA